MLIRFIVSNFMSFKEETEFNMLPASGQKRLKEHICSAGGVDVLKMAAIYGANGAGKSNLVKAMAAMKNILMESNFSGVKKFKLDDTFQTMPSIFEIEFSIDNKIYSYGLTVSANKIVEECLYKTGQDEHKLVFNRKTENDRTKIEMSAEYIQSDTDKIRIKLYETELLKDEVCLLKMLSESKEGFKEIIDVYFELTSGVQLLTPNTIISFLTQAIHSYPNVRSFLNDNISSINTGISDVRLRTSDLYSYFGKDNFKEIEEIKEELNKDVEGVFITSNRRYDDYAVKEEGNIQVKEVVSIHKDVNGNEIFFDIEEESDGTLRLLDILPWLDLAINDNNFTLIIDEIEQSIHVNLLKEIIAKFSLDNNTKGQLIFTTHESNLLDQDILRQDEIWFAEKSPAGETGFYPLSDYEIRSDLDIRKGYLNGRFGAVPFLANLHDLNWDKYGKDEA